MGVQHLPFSIVNTLYNLFPGLFCGYFFNPQYEYKIFGIPGGDGKARNPHATLTESITSFLGADPVSSARCLTTS